MKDNLKNSHKISGKFANQSIAEMSKRIKSATTTSVLGIPGAGITLFLKHLSAQPLGHMVYVDVYSLPSFKTVDFYKLLLEKLGENISPEATAAINEEALVAACQNKLELLTKQHEKIVICIAGFDQLAPEFSTKFFHYLRSLRAINPKKIVFVFGICRRLDTLLPANLIDADLSLFSSIFYLKPYNSHDLQYLFSTYGPVTDLDANDLDKMIKLSGGHFQFLQLLLGSENRNNPTQDPFIQLAFKNIFNHLSTPQKSTVRKIAINGKYSKQDQYLTNIGIVNQNGNNYELFSDLFADCVRKFSAPKLPIKERRLLTALKSNQGKIVSKHTLYDAVWRGQEVGSEWALNALIYRLRKHPAFTSQNYSIESHKKQGYMLITK